MKSFVTHKGCVGEKREIREPHIVRLTPKPDREIIYHQTMPNFPIPCAVDGGSIDTTSFMQNREELELARMVVMSWNEDYVDGSASCGYYTKFISYFYLPMGHDFGSMGFSDELSVYSENNTRPYVHDMESAYRNRIIILEERIKSLELGDRLILPQEKINEIHNAARDCHGKPIPVQHFDENIFEVD